MLGSLVIGSGKGSLAQLSYYQFLTAQSWPLNSHRPLHVKLQSSYTTQQLSSLESTWMSHTFNFSTGKFLCLLLLSPEYTNKKLRAWLYDFEHTLRFWKFFNINQQYLLQQWKMDKITCMYSTWDCSWHTDFTSLYVAICSGITHPNNCEWNRCQAPRQSPVRIHKLDNCPIFLSSRPV